MTNDGLRLAGIGLALFGVTAAARASDGAEVTYTDATATRLVADPAVGADDDTEKTYAWGDVDGDGDIDLVVARKQPWSSTGRRTNVLFLNEGGVLVDRTMEYASASDVLDDQGFLTPTNDRDIALADFNNDGRLDIITATTLSDGATKAIGHPRVYINLGHGAEGWLGFRHEDARIPQLFSDDKEPANPRFNAVAVGDVNNDGALDLYFADCDLGGPGIDLNDRLLTNNGSGFFTDVSAAVMPPAFLASGCNTSAAFADMNGDGRMDIIKSQVLGTTFGVSIVYRTDDDAFFDVQDVIYTLAATYVIPGDLDGDGLIDLVITDDGADRYLTNTGNGVDGLANFVSLVLPGPDEGFGGNAHITDIDGDGAPDILIPDVDFEIPSCSRRLKLFRNGGTGSPEFTRLVPDAFGDVDGGVHDVAIFDLDGNGVVDLVFGRCTGTVVLMGDQNTSVAFAFVDAAPTVVAPAMPTPVEVHITPCGSTAIVDGSETLWSAVGNDPFTATPLTRIADDRFAGTLPAVPCATTVRFYVSVELESGATVTNPPGGAAAPYVATAAIAVLAREDDFEAGPAGWTVENTALASGAWETAEPNGTIVANMQAAPDADASPDGTFAFVTENGLPGGTAGENDVDGGPTYLVSPVLDLDGFDARVTYRRWMFTDDFEFTGEDALTVEVSTNGGATWTLVPSQTTSSTDSQWEDAVFTIGEVAPPTATTRVRFGVMDFPNNSITEAGIDDIRFERFTCCPTDLDANGATDFADLLAVLSAWGPCADCSADLDASGVVDFADLLAVLGAWGPCPG